MAEKAFHQVMLTFRMLRVPPLEISCPEVIMGNPAYATGSFEDFVTKETNYANWFLVSSTGPIIDDYLGNGGIVLGGITHAWRASEAYLGSHIEAL